MTVLRVLSYPHILLKKVCEPIESINTDVQQFSNDLVETMNIYEGIGLAAPQVGIPKRMFVVDINPYLENPELKEWKGNIQFQVNGNIQELTFPYTFINPEFISQEEPIVFPNDGCLSVPGFSGYATERYKKITMKAQNIKGENIQIECDGILSICLQHENDHLDGIVFVQRMIKKETEKEIKAYIQDEVNSKSYKRFLKNNNPKEARDLYPELFKAKASL